MKKSVLILKFGHIKDYLNYTGSEKITLFSDDKDYILSIIPLFDTYQLDFTNETHQQKTSHSVRERIRTVSVRVA